MLNRVASPSPLPSTPPSPASAPGADAAGAAASAPAGLGLALQGGDAAKVCPVTGTAAVADLADRNGSEWLIATAIRCRLAGYEFGDIACWELGADLLEIRLGAYGPLVEAEIAGFVRRLRRLMPRPLGYHPYPARALAGDEAVLLDLLAEAGRQGPDTVKLAACLTEEHAGALAQLAAGTAARLAKAGLRLQPD